MEGKISSDMLPKKLRAKVAYFTEWSNRNKKESDGDKTKFWYLKAPAIIIAAISGFTVYLNIEVLTILIGISTAIIVGVDGIIKPGAMHKVRLMAVYDLNRLNNDIFDTWDIGIAEGKDPKKLEAEILKYQNKESKRIFDYLKKAETS